MASLHPPTSHPAGAALLAGQTATQPGQQDAQGCPGKVHSTVPLVQYSTWITVHYLENSTVIGIQYSTWRIVQLLDYSTVPGV